MAVRLVKAKVIQLEVIGPMILAVGDEGSIFSIATISQGFDASPKAMTD